MKFSLRILFLFLLCGLVGGPTQAAVITLPGGCKYEGSAKGKKPSGKGICTFPNDVRYEGDFTKGLFNGKGVLTFPNGYRVEGEFVNGRQQGKGVATWANGDRYEGDFVNGERRGKGVLTLANGNRFEGDFVKGELSGKGIHTWPNGGRYEGDFVKGARNGKGVLTLDNGGRYVGEFMDSKFTNGKQFDPDGVLLAEYSQGNIQWVQGAYGTPASRSTTNIGQQVISKSRPQTFSVASKYAAYRRPDGCLLINYIFGGTSPQQKAWFGGCRNGLADGTIIVMDESSSRSPLLTIRLEEAKNGMATKTLRSIATESDGEDPIVNEEENNQPDSEYFMHGDISIALTWMAQRLVRQPDAAQAKLPGNNSELRSVFSSNKVSPELGPKELTLSFSATDYWPDGTSSAKAIAAATPSDNNGTSSKEPSELIKAATLFTEMMQSIDVQRQADQPSSQTYGTYGQSDRANSPSTSNSVNTYSNPYRENIGGRSNTGFVANITGSRNAGAKSSTSGTSNNLDQEATQCLQLITQNGRNAITNRCARKVDFKFCGTDAGVHENVGVCGKDIGGGLLDPGEVQGLTQGRERVNYYYIGCYYPYTPFEVKWTGSSLRAETCEHY